MTEPDYELRLKVLYAQLALIDKHEKEFIEKEGRRGVEAHRDDILDEINHINRALKKIRKR
jgi:hypothetical protein